MKTRLILSTCLVLFCTPFLKSQELIQENNEPKQNIFNIMPPKIPILQIDTKTMGGHQFWGDLKFLHGYRIQQNVLTKHHRLLDPNDVRKTWGTFAECDRVLADIAAQKGLSPMKGKAVILIHGIIRSSKSFHKMGNALREDGYLVVGFDYPSTRMKLEESVKFLKSTIDSLEGVDQIDLVCHSMGGLLVRTYFQVAKEESDPRIHRLIMMGTPNQGAEMADLLKKNLAFQWVMGPAGQQLIKAKNGKIASLPTPLCEFGIVAGARGTENGWNPIIPGDDDGTVSIQSAQLSGARDFMTVNSLHSFVTEDAKGIEGVRRFLKHGHFRESGIRAPIGRDVKE